MVMEESKNSKPIEFDGFNCGRFAIFKGVEFDRVENSNYTEFGVIRSDEFDALRK